MKKLSVLIIAILFLTLPVPVFAQHVANQFCLGIYGTFSASNWPGGTIDVGCSGDTGTAGCTGHVKTLSPGQSFDFGNCTCPPFADGCLKVGRDLHLQQLSNGNRPIEGDFSLPPGCRISSSLACGVNGNVVVGSFRIDCSASPTPTRPPTATPTRVNTPTPTRLPTPTPTNRPTPTNTPRPTRTPTPIPNATPTPTNRPTPTPTTPACVNPGRVPNIQITCPTCT